MVTVTWQELRDRTDAILARVEAGDSVVITVDERPVATLQPIGRRPRYIARDEFTWKILAQEADSGLRGELRDLTRDSSSSDDTPERFQASPER